MSTQPGLHDSRARDHRARLLVALVIGVSVAVATATRVWRPGAAHAAASQPAAPRVEQSTPEQAVASLLEHLRAQLRAAAAQQRAAEKTLRMAALPLVDPQVFAAAFDRVNKLKNVSDEEFSRNLLVNWAAQVAFYVDGFDLPKLRSVEGDRALVTVVCHRAEFAATLLADCRRMSAGLWRIASLSFEGP